MLLATWQSAFRITSFRLKQSPAPEYEHCFSLILHDKNHGLNLPVRPGTIDIIPETQKMRDDGYRSETELSVRDQILQLLQECPVPPAEYLSNLGLFLQKDDFSRMLFLDEIYQLILNVHGSIIEFGSRWGNNLCLFETLRGIYEPFNRNRKIIGFDSFAGFPDVTDKDGTHPFASEGAYSVSENYEEYLEKLLSLHRQVGPRSHLKGFDLVKGDACKTIHEYLEAHPETVVALAFFDFDIYEPTRECLEAIRPHITRGSVIVFDELNVAHFPGETVALRETFGLENIRIQHSPFSASRAYFIVE